MIVGTIHDLARFVGQPLGHSKWRLIDQAMINAFAELTGDRHWIHVDVDRAAKEMPDGKTIAHGLFILSLIPSMGTELLTVTHRAKGLNYGMNKVRFTSPVQCGDKIRLSRRLTDVDYRERAARLTYENTVEIEGRSKPALISESLMIVYEK